METMQIEVESQQLGQRLDRFLAERLGVSRARVRHLLEVGRVFLVGPSDAAANGDATSDSPATGPPSDAALGDGPRRPLSLSDKSRTTRAGDVFELSGPLRADEERPTPRPDLPLTVVSEGSGWLVVDKPAGCGVHPLRPDQVDTVLNAVAARHPEMIGVGEGGLRSGIVHRLDVDTTGALAFATDEPHWKWLRGAFSEHRVDKRYLALVAGRFEQPRRVSLPLAITRHSPAHVEVSEGGRPCRQRVVPLRLFETTTLVEVRLETGFLHQIRATLSHLGHPLLGDAEYGGAADVDGASISRPMLHAARLRVDEIDAEVAPPADFEAALAALGAAGTETPS